MQEKLAVQRNGIPEYVQQSDTELPVQDGLDDDKDNQIGRSSPQRSPDDPKKMNPDDIGDDIDTKRHKHHPDIGIGVPRSTLNGPKLLQQRQGKPKKCRDP